ncbi:MULTISPECIES: ABC transporter ATP-binding protein [Acetobacter]|uniref:ATP-binding cassette subfamily B protein n=1 Tax=Acetobacter lovaniensis TaxID=104100 RepID=A0A841QJ02_9PROT|nr:ABC transporter ATP-binding protein [Acetobacter lovaniensis]MBB6458581.1 ATP-binding cassette subfamily B protein [Acetobacter lovaniensis]MCI1698925.1 ABC transporter ATP-binding protein/permease [Acetobacter lovaniensis]MCP1240767.1 ABC transporter ATP-binding protein/permease [Acetobacter lovaniensis]NHN82771.1 ATP-binding cassette domain-containing protein [Acetobacter lovaniensis]
MVTSASSTASAARKTSLFVDVLGFVMRLWLAFPQPLAVTVGTVLLATLADVLMPLAAGRLVADVAEPASQSTRLEDALWMLAALAACGFGSVLAKRCAYLGITRLTTRVMQKIGTESFAHVQRLSTDWHANTFAGSTVRRLTRGMWAVDMLDDTLLLMLLPEFCLLVLTTLVLGWHWPAMGVLLGVLSVLFVALSCTLTLYYVAPSAQAANAGDSKVGAALADAMTCNAVVKAFGAETREEAHLARILDQWRTATARMWIRGTDSANIQAAAVVVMRLSLAAAAIWLWCKGRAGPGDVAYVLTMTFLVQGYLREIGQQVSVVQRSVNEMEELLLLWRTPAGVADPAQPVTLHVTYGEIAFEHVTFQYPGQQTPLFTDLSVHIAPGSRVGLVGPSGSGKSTFTKLLLRLYAQNSGRVLVDGVDTQSVRQADLRRQIALVPQEPVLFHRSLAENIAYGRPDATPEQIVQAARLANAADFIERLPEGYATLVGERGIKLSGGERQRVAIARAFLADARILVLDEATASLDSASEALVQEAMERLMEGRTVLIVAHRLSTVVGLDRILVFEHGQIVEDGTHAQLVQQEGGLYQRLYNLQSL